MLDLVNIYGQRTCLHFKSQRYVILTKFDGHISDMIAVIV